MEEDFNFAEMITKILMDAGRKRARRDAAQQAVERVVRLVGWFDGKDGRGRRDEARVLLSSGGRIEV